MHIDHANKARVLEYWAALDSARVEQLPEVAAHYLPENYLWKGPAPLGTITGPAALSAQVLAPLRRAIPDLARQTHLFMGGQSSAHVGDDAQGAHWVAGAGYFSGTSRGSFLGIPATGQTLRIRWIEIIRFKGGIMLESQVILDFVDWFEQIGLSVLPASRGLAHVFPAPTAYDGVLLDPQSADETALTLQLGEELIYGGLNGFDRSKLASMGMANFFHPNLKWYGPGGIGACLSFSEFETQHQQPWLVAFPDRKVVALESLLAEGRLLACSGVASVHATHTGEYLGAEASGASLTISGMDFWLRTDGQFSENWVFVDMIDLFAQMGVDLFQRMATLRDQKSGWIADNGGIEATDLQTA